MPRRKDNEIYTYKLKSGKKRFGFKTYIGINKENGKAVKVTRQGFISRKEAEQAKIELKAQGTYKVVQKRRQKKHSKTVDQVWQEWLKIYQFNVRPSTLLRTKTYYRIHVEPEFKNDYINAISAKHLQDWINYLAANYVKYKALIRLLKRLVKFAIIKGYVKNNPFERIVIPKKGKAKSKDSKENYLTLDQLRDFLAAAKKMGITVYTCFFLTFSLGLRRGETLGLEWQDIDFKKKLAHIRRTVSFDVHDKKMIGPTKTFDKYRRVNGIPVSDSLIEALTKYKQYLKANNLDNSKYIFHNKSGEFLNPSMTSYWIVNLYKKNPTLKRITMHGLRHTLATLLFEQNKNIQPQQVQYMLGHKNVKTTLDIYTSITKKERQGLKTSINNLKI